MSIQIIKNKILPGSVVLILLWFTIFQAGAQIRLPSVLQSNMVLQQQSEVKLWGWANPGEGIKVKLSWQKEKIPVVAGSLGRWEVKIKTGKAGDPVSILLKGKKNKIKLENILFGEVWLCSGQSNMEFTLKMLGGWDSEFYKEGKDDFIHNDYSDIRLFTVKRNTANEPEDDCTGEWKHASLASVEEFSAIAFFYGRQLYKKLKVPIGLINTSWGGTRAEAWINPDLIETSVDLEFYRFDSTRNYRSHDIPGSLFNGMINPLLNYNIKGVIWYQGEANRNDAMHYKNLFSALIWNWRTKFKQELLPFYYVQIAPFNYKEPMVGALIREAQLKTLQVPSTGMVVSLDIGNFNNIHPKNKQEAGRRLALIALRQNYGFSELEYSGPVYTRGRVENIPWIEDMKGIRLSFDHAGAGLVLKDNFETGFTVAGKNQVFYKADAKIEGNSVVVWSEHVPKPYAVRYAFINTPVATLFNNAGLPASSFRTDQFRVFTSAAEIKISSIFSNQVMAFKIDNSEPELQLRYTLDGSEPGLKSPLYYTPVVVRETTKLKVRAFHGNQSTEIQKSVQIMVHEALNKTVKYNSPYQSGYPGEEETNMVDGLKGDSLDYSNGWQGYEGNDLDLTIDLEKNQTISFISIGFLQQKESWIFFPEYIEFFYSEDGKTFLSLLKIENNVSPLEEGSFVKEFSAVDLNIKARYIKVFAGNIGVCPPEHVGSGGKAWIFSDEIIINPDLNDAP